MSHGPTVVDKAEVNIAVLTPQVTSNDARVAVYVFINIIYGLICGSVI